MKKFNFIPFLLLSLLVCPSCNNSNNNGNNNNPIDDPGDDPSGDDENTFKEELVQDSQYSGYEITYPHKEKATSGTETITFYALNDLHGHINDDVDLTQIGSFIKDKAKKDNTLIIDSGDTWQGTFESNELRGKTITDVYNNAHVSVRTIGNHDFDWGVNALKENTAKKSSTDQYFTPVLGSNIYDFDWDTKTVGNTQQKDLGRDYATFVLQSGIKVGVVGVIGDDQITSICSNLVQDLTFTDHNERIKSVATYLRQNKKCDVVVASAHASYAQTQNQDLSSYVDAVFNAHSHYNEQFKEDQVPFVQFGANGNCIGKVELKYNLSTNKIDKSATTITKFNQSSIASEVSKIGIDSEIKNIVQGDFNAIKRIGEEVLCSNCSGNFDRYEGAANLMCEAIYYTAVAQGYDIKFAMCNVPRTYISTTNGKMTYADLYEAFPFDNTVYIANVWGTKAVTELTQYNYVYNTGISKIDSSTVYKVAVLDYVLLHVNNRRQYDYFPNQSQVGYLVKSDGTTYTYRELLADYIRRKSSLDANNYSSELPCFTHPSSN